MMDQDSVFTCRFCHMTANEDDWLWENVTDEGQYAFCPSCKREYWSGEDYAAFLDSLPPERQ